MKTTAKQVDKEVHEFNILLHGHGVETSEKKKVKYECLYYKYACEYLHDELFLSNDKLREFLGVFGILLLIF